MTQLTATPLTAVPLTARPLTALRLGESEGASTPWDGGSLFLEDGASYFLLEDGTSQLILG